jgi:arsenate reductase (glutaredoxin)
MKLYGIPNCNTVKKARLWLDKNNMCYTFHDYKKLGLTQATINQWLMQLPWEKLVNRTGMTWRNLSEESKASITDNASASVLMIEKTSVIKRPILEKDDVILCIGFDEDTYKEIVK